MTLPSNNLSTPSVKIQEYWVVDLRTARLLAYTDPKDDTYQTVRELHRGDSFVPRLLPACLIRGKIAANAA